MVDFKSLRKEVKGVKKILKSNFHQKGLPKTGAGTIESFIVEEEERIGKQITEPLRQILLEYGDHALNFKIPKEGAKNRYIFGRGFMHGVSAFDWGGFNKIKHAENST